MLATQINHLIFLNIVKYIYLKMHLKYIFITGYGCKVTTEEQNQWSLAYSKFYNRFISAIQAEVIDIIPVENKD